MVKYCRYCSGKLYRCSKCGNIGCSTPTYAKKLCPNAGSKTDGSCIKCGAPAGYRRHDDL